MENEGMVKPGEQPVRLVEHFVISDRFHELFSSGMDLVDETATFLDTEGRKAAKGLSKTAAAVYGAESMRLTTRLMQLASWLLLQRAVGEGEMTVDQAITEKKNVKLNQLPSHTGGPGWDELPESFFSLVERSIALQRRIKRLDDEIYSSEEPVELSPHNPVASQLAILETAFDPRFGR